MGTVPSIETWTPICSAALAEWEGRATIVTTSFAHFSSRTLAICPESCCGEVLDGLFESTRDHLDTPLSLPTDFLTA